MNSIYRHIIIVSTNYVMIIKLRVMSLVFNTLTEESEEKAACSSKTHLTVCQNTWCHYPEKYSV